MQTSCVTRTKLPQGFQLGCTAKRPSRLINGNTTPNGTADGCPPARPHARTHTHCNFLELNAARTGLKPRPMSRYLRVNSVSPSEHWNNALKQATIAIYHILRFYRLFFRCCLLLFLLSFSRPSRLSPAVYSY